VGIRKYISLNSFKDTIVDNFRYMMGQYFYVDNTGRLSYGYGDGEEEFQTLNIPADGVLTNDPISVTYDSGNPFEENKLLNVKRIPAPSGEPAHGEPEWDAPYLEYGLWGRDPTLAGADGNVKTLYLNVSAEFGNYETLQKFAEDMGNIFKNPTPQGEEDYFYEESFEFEKPQVTDERFIVEAFYNFFDETYETSIRTIPETSLPNVHVLDLAAWQVAARTGEGLLHNDVKEHVELYGSIDLAALPSSPREYKDYLIKWVPAYLALDSEETRGLEDRGKNIIIPYRSRKEKISESPVAGDFEPISSNITKMPFGISIKFPVESFTTIETEGGDSLFYVNQSLVGDTEPTLGVGIGDSLGIWASHLASCIDSNTFLGNPSAADQYGLVGSEYIANFTFTVNTLQTTRPLTDVVFSSFAQQTPGPYDVKYNSVMAFVEECHFLGSGDETRLEHGLETAEVTFNLDKKIIIDDINSVENQNIQDLSTDYETVASSLDIADHYRYWDHGHRIHNYARGGTAHYTMNIHENSSAGRTYKEAFEDYANKAAGSYNQTVLYRIAKHKGEDATTAPIQNIWIPATDLEEDIHYIDSQVNYGQTYTYKIYAYKYVFGMKYKYRQVTAPTIEEITNVVDAGGEVLGYKVTWFGFNNLFSDFAAVAIMINRDGEDRISRWRGYWLGAHRGSSDPVEVHHLDDDTGMENYSQRNVQYFSIDQIRDVMRVAWDIRPGVGENESPSWSEIFGEHQGTPDFDDGWFNEEMLIQGGRELHLGNRISAFGVGDIGTGLYLGDAGHPSEFSLQDWIYMFFGYSEEDAIVGWGVGAFPIKNRSQGIPPSHHLLDEGNPINDEDWSGVTYATGVEKGTESYWDWARDEGEFEGDYADWTQNYGVLEGVELGEYSVVETTGYGVNYALDMYSNPRIVETPYLSITTSVMSKPPLVPEIEIIPYRGVNDRLLFTFNAPNGTMEEIPITITTSDEDMIAKQYQAQGKVEGEILEFKSDDIPAGFQIFRLDKAPNSYRDFDKNLRATTSTLFSAPGEKPVRAHSTTYEEKLQSNIKYYYTFRTVDFHGNVSNPTIIYEVELVDDGGAVYLIVNTYQIPFIESKVASKQMKKLIQIVPKLEQSIVAPSVVEGATDPDDVGDIKLGAEDLEDYVWGKKFKIRLTSNKTGKKIDFNVNFNFVDERTVPDLEAE